MTAIVAMNSQGRITVPAAARKALGIEGDTQFELDVMENELVLRPAVVIPRADAWVYTPEHREKLRRADEDVKAGRVSQISREDLLRLAEEADKRNR